MVAGGRLLILSQSTEPLISEQSRNGEIVAFPLQPTHHQLQQHWWFNYFKLLLNVCFHFVVEIHHENDLFLHISKLSIYRNDIPKMMVTKLE